ncbi:hypothetical protein B1987_22370 [Mycobacterium kansasii]|uniref:Uncharacterized protein n=2 Tax=Mycobacterium attenuatum TaxID=2341086 RepID=A0A498PV52_9MYCO|nr:hypothetical protein B1987_22370 [Mycobacterium kansasii]VBA36554.1 hypothetical protein LAUMK136_01446 [Mycobacterium attenuatum]VBA49101.1 hypothetical protein LAUMK191_01437 [Mycobacterium attenuatum]VBA54600.1 hypothetical protein LAUMK41_01508 [Mycobacterium attenuatum]
MAGHRQHFAVHVSRRRQNLGMTLVDVNRNGGPTAPTLAKAEAGALEDPRPSTLSKFDVGLRWVPGSAANTYWGGDEPRPREQVGKRAVLEPTDGTVALPLERILAMMTTQAQLSDVLDGHSAEPIPAGEIRPIVDTLNQHLSAVVGHYVTDLLERNHATDYQPMAPLLEYAFAELLSAPVSADDPQKLDKLYRRWLLGYAENIDTELEASFRRRLRRRSYPREESGK